MLFAKEALGSFHAGHVGGVHEYWQFVLVPGVASFAQVKTQFEAFTFVLNDEMSNIQSTGVYADVEQDVFGAIMVQPDAVSMSILTVDKFGIRKKQFLIKP